MNTNSGIASRTSLVMTPNTRGGSAPRSEKRITPRTSPRTAKINATPPSVSATG